MIPIHYIQQYLFCKRRIYFYELTDIVPIRPKHVNDGNEYHEKMEELSKQRGFKKIKFYFNEKIQNKYIEDKVLGFCGKPDLLLINEQEVVPIEYKININNHISYGYKLQTIAYGLLAANVYGKKFAKGYLMYKNNTKSIEIKPVQTDIDNLKKNIDEIMGIIESGIFPDNNGNVNKCLQCEYLNYCNDCI
jgi:CRISPR-associated exonuclease Cas4